MPTPRDSRSATPQGVIEAAVLELIGEKRAPAFDLSA